MNDFIEFTCIGDKRTLERKSNIISITENSNLTRIHVSYKFSDGSDYYDVYDSYDSIKEKLMEVHEYA